jgi:hypothetical protein
MDRPRRWLAPERAERRGPSLSTIVAFVAALEILLLVPLVLFLDSIERAVGITAVASAAAALLLVRHRRRRPPT